jgi:hypothetical protein
LKMDCVSPKRRRRRRREQEQELPEQVRDRLAGLLDEEALEEAVQGLGPEELTGPEGLLTQLAGRVIEAALEAELSASGLSAGRDAAGGEQAQWRHAEDAEDRSRARGDAHPA